MTNPTYAAAAQAFYLEAMGGRKNHAAPAFETAYLRSKVDALAAPAQPAPITCKSEQKRLATLWGFVPVAPAQAGEYPELPKPQIHEDGAWRIEYFTASNMRAYVDADRAARGVAQAAPVDADPLQGAADWLVQAHVGLEVSTLGGKLSIGHNRAKRLYDAARAAQEGKSND